jgi:hypothetical protein
MKVEISNLGIIEKAEIDLKPLTVFIGRNGEGKTWAAYTLSAIFGHQGYGHYLKAYLDGNSQQTYPTLDSALKQLFEEGNAQIDAIQFANEYAETYINDVARLAPNWMRSFMATERANFNDLQVYLDLAETKVEFLERIKAASVQRGISLGLLNAVKETGEDILYFYAAGDILKKLPEKVIKQFLVREIFQILHRAFFAYVYTFPIICFVELKDNIGDLGHATEQVINTYNSFKVHLNSSYTAKAFIYGFAGSSPQEHQEYQRKLLKEFGKNNFEFGRNNDLGNFLRGVLPKTGGGKKKKIN